MEERDFTCSFCLDVLHGPILLPCCSANFCRACLRDMVEGGLGSCPNCRTALPPLDVSAMAVNRLVAAIISKYLPEHAQRRLEETLHESCCQSTRQQGGEAGAGSGGSGGGQQVPAYPTSREDCEKMSVRALKRWMKTTGVSSASCIERHELVQLAQSFFCREPPPPPPPSCRGGGGEQPAGQPTSQPTTAALPLSPGSPPTRMITADAPAAEYGQVGELTSLSDGGGGTAAGTSVAPDVARTARLPDGDDPRGLSNRYAGRGGGQVCTGP
jgi:hypothetical protein